jgi:hypothetical protein
MMCLLLKATDAIGGDTLANVLAAIDYVAGQVYAAAGRTTRFHGNV